MSAQYELTWHAARRCWKKKLRKDTYYCPIKCQGKSDWDGYKASLDWWKGRQAELDGEHQKQIQSEELFLPPAQLNQLHLERQRRADYAASGKPSYEDWQEQQQAVEEVRRQRATTDQTQTVGSYLGRFLDLKRSQAVVPNAALPVPSTPATASTRCCWQSIMGTWRWW